MKKVQIGGLFYLRPQALDWISYKPVRLVNEQAKILREVKLFHLEYK